MKERNQIIIKLILSHFVPVIGLFFLTLFFIKDSYLLISITQSALLVLFLAGYWEFFGLKFKGIFCSGIEILILIELLYKLFFVNILTPNIYLFSLLILIQLILLWIIVKIFVVIFKIDKESLEIEFPFDEGLYLITDGGNSKKCRLMNYHFHSHVHKKKNTNLAMLYATDIVKLKNKNKSFLPLINEKYPIFNEKVYSPMEGLIVWVVDEIDDNSTFSGNYPYNTGNTVVIKKDNYFFLLGHLKKGSIVVKVGDLIKRKDLLGVVGNSGMSERPHLHMQLMKCESSDYWKGVGIGIKYKGKNLYKNRLIK